MSEDRSPYTADQTTESEPDLPSAISLDEASDIADEVQDLIRAGEERSAWERMSYLHPADIASIVVSLPSASRDALIKVMSPESVVWLLRRTNPLVAGRVATRVGSQVLSFALGQVNPRVALDVLKRIPTRKAREVAVGLDQPLTDDEALTRSEDTAGALMVDAFPTVGADEPIQAALDSLRALEDIRHKFTHVYVLGNNGELVGQIHVVDLALAGDATPARSISTGVVAVVEIDTPEEECGRLQRHYNVTQLPVVQDGKLVGVVIDEFLLSAIVEDDTRQMLQVASVADESVGGPLSSSVKARIPWLTVNLGTTFLSAAAVAIFEPTLAQLVVLAAFLPVVTGQSGIGGTQTLTLIVRAIALGELVGVGAVRLLAREALLGLIHGIWLALLVSIIALVWTQNIGLSIITSVSILGSMVVASMAGAGVPLFLRRFGMDPAVASAVVVTTITDVFSILLFLGISTAAIMLLI